MPNSGYRKCPNCGSKKFYVDNEKDGLVFFRAGQDGVIYSSQDPAVPLKLADTSEIFCVSCGWHGKLGDLSAPA